MDKLKPCPFCGAEARIVTNYCGGTKVMCSNLYECSIHQEWWDIEEDAIAAWNRRAGEADADNG